MRRLQLATLGLAALLAASAANATTTIATVDSLSGPWLESATMNAAFQYGSHDESAPTSVASGFDFTAGGSFTISYLDGLTSAYGGVPPYADAGGDITYVANGNGGSSGNGFPSQYMDYSTQDIYLNELVGAFGDGAGNVVGTPFAIGNGATVVAPGGAHQLLLGFNDDIFGDNSGAIRVQVSGPTLAGGVPEPATWAMMIGGVGLMGGALRRGRRMTPATA